MEGTASPYNQFPVPVAPRYNLTQPQIHTELVWFEDKAIHYFALVFNLVKE